jgi:hypothetical protein
LLFDGKSLWGKNDPVKEENRAKGSETREASEGKGTMPVGTLKKNQRQGVRVKCLDG